MNHNLGLGVFLLSTGISTMITIGITKPKSAEIILGVILILLGSIGIARAFPKKPN